MAESCKGCHYWRYGGIQLMCHYLLDTDEKRNCSVESCTHYITEKEYEKMKKQRIPAEVRERVIQAAREGVPYKAVAEQLGLSPQSVSRLAVEAGIIRNPERIKKSPETVSTPIEPVTEDITNSENPADTNIITDVPEVVKPAESYDTALLNPTVCGAVLDRINKTDEELATLRRDIMMLEKEKKALEDYLRKYKEVQNNGT